MAKKSSSNHLSDLNIGRRIAEIASASDLNQKGFAERLGVSQGFISSVVNNQAVPESEFLWALHMEFGVSADWVLTGIGSMYGERLIDIPLFKEIRTLVATARAAIIDDEPTAKAIVILVNSDNLEITSNDLAMRVYPNNLVGKDCDIDWVVSLYNRYLAAYTQKSSRRQVMADAISHFQLLKPVDFSKQPSVDSTIPSQVNIFKAKNVRNTAGNYYEIHKPDE